MQAIFDLIQQWQSDTFGPRSFRGPAGTLKHLAKEAIETLKKPNDLEEHADLWFLVIDSLWRSGFSYEQLQSMLKWKLEKNKARTWPAPSQDDTPIEHHRYWLDDDSRYAELIDALVAAEVRGCTRVFTAVDAWSWLVADKSGGVWTFHSPNEKRQSA